MTRSLRCATATAAVLAGLCAFSLQGDAQQPDSARRLPPQSVTAARQPASIFDVPLAVTIIGAEQLRAKRGVGLDEALSLVPGAFAQSRAGGSDVRISIRGFGARGAGDRSNAGTSRGIRVLLDGIPETEPDGRTAFDLLDLSLVDEVEVVRSNASALYGNAAGGVVELRSIPPPGTRRLSGEAQTGAFGLQRVIVRGARPAGAGSMSAGFASTHLDGWRDHAQSDRVTVLAGIRAPLGDQTVLGVLAAAGNHRFQIPGPLTLVETLRNPRLANATYAARDERRYNRIARLATTLEHRIDSAHSLSAALFVAPKILQRSERGTYRDFTRFHIGGNVVYRGAHTLGDGVAGRLSIGVDEAYQDGAILFYNLTPAGSRGKTLRNNKREGANNTGVFVQEELAINRRLLVSLALRRDVIWYVNQDFLVPALDASRSFSRTIPKVGATWKLSPSHSLYASIGGGVEAPAGNETDPASTFGQDSVTGLNPLLEPISSTTYEVGMKRVIVFGESAAPVQLLQYDVALYHTAVSNEIIPYRGGRFYFTAGKVRRQGGEVGLSLAAAHGFDARGALTINRHRYREYVVDSVHYGVPGRSANYAGNRAVGVPNIHYGVMIGFAPSWLSSVRLESGVTGVGRYYADDANSVVVPGYTLLSASVRFDNPTLFGVRTGARGFASVNNLAGRRYIGSAFLNPDVVNGVPVAFEPGPPREVVIGLTLGVL